jgi:tellurite resistance protein
LLYQLRNLTDIEKNAMVNAPVWVTLLIACADNDLNPDEIKKAAEIIHARSFSEESDVRNLYKEIDEDFNHLVQIEINNLPLVGEERIEQLTENLKQLNAIYPKLEHAYATQFHRSLQKLASLVAQADGGFLGIGSISYKEAEYIKLPMITAP